MILLFLSFAHTHSLSLSCFLSQLVGYSAKGVGDPSRPIDLLGCYYFLLCNINKATYLPSDGLFRGDFFPRKPLLPSLTDLFVSGVGGRGLFVNIVFPPARVGGGGSG